ncbi:hypothetical protein J2W54_003892 [Rhodococcus fascians]|uniref:DUF6542 domain-containing protein n=1 Tax=Nocardiaceae TaxID=85025 RepID=UPI0015C661BF|nr:MULTISPECIES: DUF6542 domain-containing protein [Rhodococcus]MDR6911884.1 hypothetical protein [Rhodococcus sp. 3258]MDR6933486.1 hypothetical protein [Rhodococcus fascians]GHP19476.1 hypothetical protein RN2511_042120 [Rhodococcus sp. NKCM2511]
MSTSQRARSGVPLDHRSILATLPGVPAWGAVAIAAGLAFLGFLIDAARGTELTGAFAFLYILGCIAAVLLVRYRGLFTAMVQAPLILFVAVPLSYQYFTDNAGTSLKDIILNVAIPLVNRFPLMLLGTLVAVGLGAVRIVLKRQNTHAPAVRRSTKTADTARRRTKPEDAPRRSTKAGDSARRSPTSEDDTLTRAQRRAQEDRPSRARSRRAAADRDDVSAVEATDIVPEPYVGRRGTSRAATDSGAAPRRSATTPGATPGYARQASPQPEYQRPSRSHAQYPQDRTPPPGVARPSRPQPSEAPYSTEPRRERSPRVQPPRDAVDPYSSSARHTVEPVVNDAPPNVRRDDIPPHPVPQVRYRDRHADD